MTKKTELESGEPTTSAPVMILGLIALLYLLGALMLSAVFVLGLCLVGAWLLFGQVLAGGGG